MNLEGLNQLKRLVCGCSGGVDSIVLAHLLQKNLIDAEIHIVIVNHNLRLNSGKEAENVLKALILQGFEKVKILEWKHEKIDIGIEEKARTARQNLIFGYAFENGITDIFLGHHFGDLEENFFLKLGMGAGIFGLTSMQKRKEYRWNGLYFNVFRPLMQFSKHEIIDFATKNKLFFVQDETNFEDKFKRNRLRKKLEDFEVQKSCFLASFQGLLMAENILKNRLKELFSKDVIWDENFGFFSAEMPKITQILRDEMIFALKQMIFYFTESCEVRAKELENAINFLQNLKPFTLGGMEVFFAQNKVFFIKEVVKINHIKIKEIWDLRFHILEEGVQILPKLPYKIIKTLPFCEKNLEKKYFLKYKIKPVEFKIL